MVKYSQHDLLSEEIKKLKYTSNSFLERIENVIFSLMCSNVNMDLKIPTFTYLRANVLCEDISGMINANFNIYSLMQLLYQDFLNHVQRSNDLYRVYRTLQVSSPDCKIDHYQSITLLEEKKDLQPLQILIKRKKVLRCEVFLNDLDSIVPNHGFTVEKILEMLLMDFIKNYTSGNYPKLVDDLIERLEKWS